MKKAVRIISIILITTLLTGSFGSAGAVSFDSLDANTAVAGASQLLSQYFEANENAGEIIARVLNPATVNDNESELVAGESVDAPVEIEYDTPSVGVVCAATYLKIRKGPSTENDVVGSVMNGGEITAVGEITVNDVLWFKVKTADADGYASGMFILFGQDAEDYRKTIEEEKQVEENGLKAMPTTFALKNDVSGLPSDKADAIKYYASEVRYCLETAYPDALASGNYTNTYSVLVYILEMLQKVADIAGAYGLTETSNLALQDAAIVEAHRANLCESTNKDDSDYEQEIRDAHTTAASETTAPATTAAPETQPQTQASQETSPSTPEVVTEQGQAIVDYALQFVGWLPYVWGGSSLETGCDCSGFCAQIYAHFGLLDQSKANTHDYDSYGLRSVGYEVAQSEMQPGDLVCYQGHVAIYIGNGQIVHEPSEGKMCEIGSVNVLTILTVRRLY